MSITVITKKTWKSLRKLYETNYFERTDNVHWIFRGEKRRKDTSNDWNIIDMQTSLNKAFKSFNPNHYKRSNLEISLLREFQRKAHHHLSFVPKVS